jgi:hypothetical protein
VVMIVSKNITATRCKEPVRDRTKITNLLCGVTGGLALLAVSLRTANALYIGAFGKDDACALLAGIFMVVDNAVTFPAGPAGYGLDIWMVPFENITFILKVRHSLLHFCMTNMMMLAGFSHAGVLLAGICTHKASISILLLTDLPGCKTTRMYLCDNGTDHVLLDHFPVW